MITIKTVDSNNAELHIEKGTPHMTYLLGIEMLVEALLKQVPSLSIGNLLDDLKRIYERDNEK